MGGAALPLELELELELERGTRVLAMRMNTEAGGK